MTNEKLRIRAMRDYAQNAIDRANEDDPNIKDIVTEYARAKGWLEGAMKVIVNDCNFWLTEMADEERSEPMPGDEPMDWDAALGEGRV